MKDSKDSQLMSEHIKKMRLGSVESFDYIYNQTHKSVYRLISLNVNNKMDVEDIMSEVYVQLWTSSKNYNPSKPFKPWLNGVVMNQVNTHRRKNWQIFRRFEKYKALVTNQEFMYETNMLEFEEKDETMRIIASLSYKLRSVIVLRYYANHSLEEIAEILKIPVGTVKSRHSSALKQLARKIEPKDMKLEVRIDEGY